MTFSVARKAAALLRQLERYASLNDNVLQFNPSQRQLLHRIDEETRE